MAGLLTKHIAVTDDERNPRHAERSTTRGPTIGSMIGRRVYLTSSIMTETGVIRRPVLASHTRYRWDKVRNQHQLVFPEGMIVLNESGTAIVRLFDGRSTDDVIATLKEAFPGAEPAGDVHDFLRQLAERGLVRDDVAD